MKINDVQEDIDLMKKHLSSLRKISGWTCEELGEMIGLSKQTISGLETNPTTKISKAQYIALRTIFEIKAKEDKNESLEAVIRLIFEDKDNYKKNESKINESIKMLAGAATAAVGVASLTPLMPLLGIPAIGISAGAFIASKIFKKK